MAALFAGAQLGQDLLKDCILRADEAVEIEGVLNRSLPLRDSGLIDGLQQP